jgi:N-glycosylase/DNA lyase
MPNLINVSDFDLAGTLECGQTFRWHRLSDGWFEGVVDKDVWRLRQRNHVLESHCSRETFSQPTCNNSRKRDSRQPVTARDNPEKSPGLQNYLALDCSLPQILATFPNDPPLRQAVQEHHGLRVIRQKPWECLASFMASSTKQIVQIRQIVGLLAQRFGEPIDDTHHAFPTASVIARATHQQLWDCKLGFRAKNLLAAAQMIDGGNLDLDALRSMEYERALEALMKLPGVGEKIANCTLLFACGFNHAFPIDVWIDRALRRIYFNGRKRVRARELREFARSHFGPYAGWAQQYLFYNERTQKRNRG